VRVFRALPRNGSTCHSIYQTTRHHILENGNLLCRIIDTHQLLAYAAVVNLLGDKTEITKKGAETLSKEVGLEVNTEKTKYMLLSRHQNAGQCHDITIGNRCFENVGQFRYLGRTITNQNLIQEEIKNRLNSGNACYHSAQKLLSSRLLPQNVKVECTKL
jgi:hypothetical protein